MSANGDFYWVFANVTPDYGANGQVKGYYSVRRKPSENAIKAVTPLYQEMLAIEKRSNAKEGPDRSIAYLKQFLADNNTTYQNLALNLYRS
ncbi:MAG: hypothetical protein DRQ61_08965 [Gammaproteobacteria bacterium]|nr:MAG: hypothetical protein DRQ61_08965 [Gammaproteobacteria bacterium]